MNFVLPFNIYRTLPYFNRILRTLYDRNEHSGCFFRIIGLDRQKIKDQRLQFREKQL